MTHTKNVHNKGVTNTCWRTGQNPLKVPSNRPDILENAKVLHKLWGRKHMLADRAEPIQGTNQLTHTAPNTN